MSDYFDGGVLSKCAGEACSSNMVIMPTLKQRLDQAVREAEARLSAVQEARDIFERNPDIERLLDIMQRSHF